MEDPKTIKLSITCPVESCKKSKMIEIPKYLFDNRRLGMLKIPIHSGTCCEHEFIAFISRKGYEVRGYEIIDTSVDFSHVEKKDEEERFYLQDLLTKYGDYATGAIVHAILLDKPIVILRTKYEKNNSIKISNLLSSFLPEKYLKLVNVHQILDTNYKKAKISDSLVISPNGLVANTPWKDISDKYERDFINKALEILDSQSQTILIQNEIERILDQANFVYKIISEKEIFEDDLKEDLNKQFNLKITDNYLKLLKQIVGDRFGGKISRIKIRSFSKLKEGLW